MDLLLASVVLKCLWGFAARVRQGPERRSRLGRWLSLQFGLTALLLKNLYVEPSVSFGLNGRGHSLAVGVTMPCTF